MLKVLQVMAAGVRALFPWARMTMVGETQAQIKYVTSDSAGIDERSEISVRRSTMDLVSMYKEQENMEMERVLKMARAEGMKGL